MEQAIAYVAELENNYPMVIKAVHTTKASTILLKHKKHKLKEMLEEGFVDDGDYADLRLEIDQSLVKIQIKDFELSEVKFNEVLTECPLFSNLPTQEIVNIRMKSTERVFPPATTIQLKGREIKNVYFIISGSVKEQFEEFYLMRGIGNMLNSHDFIYKEESKAMIKTLTETKVIQIQDKVIDDLLERFPEFRKRWFKSVFPYSLKLGRGHNFFEESFTSRELRRFIESSSVAFLTPGEVMSIDHGAYIFNGEVQSDGSNYMRGNFISKEKVIKSVGASTILKFTDVIGLKPHDDRISCINDQDD